jgi:S-DNA-T family DNA segregation ATPase FtsK/SpoIIIE
MHRLAATARASAAGIDPARLPFQVRPLPHRISTAELRLPRHDSPLWTAIGVAGDSAGTIGVDLAADGPGFLIAGPSRSGRSTALLTMAMGLLAAGTRVALLGPRRSPLRGLAGRDGVIGCFEPDDGEILAAATSSACAVIVDDIQTCTDTPAGDVLTALLQADDGRRAVIGAGRADELAMVFRGPALAIRAARSGLLLSPGPADGELLGARLPRVSGRQPPGRGVLIVAGEQTAVQVALPDRPEPGKRIGLGALASY